MLLPSINTDMSYIPVQTYYIHLSPSIKKYSSHSQLMASLLKLFSSILLLFLFNQVAVEGTRLWKCSAESIVITQVKTGRIVEGKPEYEVTVSNMCRCSQARVMTRCYGLSSVEPLDNRVIKPVDESMCVVNGGRPVAGGTVVRFKYAWMTPQDFPIVSSQIKC